MSLRKLWNRAGARNRSSDGPSVHVSGRTRGVTGEVSASGRRGSGPFKRKIPGSGGSWGARHFEPEDGKGPVKELPRPSHRADPPPPITWPPGAGCVPRRQRHPVKSSRRMHPVCSSPPQPPRPPQPACQDSGGRGHVDRRGVCFFSPRLMWLLGASVSDTGQTGRGGSRLGLGLGWGEGGGEDGKP